MSYLNTKPTRKPDDYFYDADSFWGRESERLLAAAIADPSNRSLRTDLDHAEKARERAHEKAAAKWEREQEREYAAQWTSEAFGPETTFDGDW